MSRLIIITLTCLIFVSSRGYAAPQYVTGIYQPVEDGYLVQFTLNNILSGEVLTAWRISTADATKPVTPAGWSIYHDFRQVQWISDGPIYQLPSGQSKDGFGFVLPSAPGTLNWWILSNLTTYTGTVTPTKVPSNVPEPSSILALFGGLASIGGFALRRRK